MRQIKDLMMDSNPSTKEEGLVKFVKDYALSGEQVVYLFLDYLGSSVINEEFVDFLEAEEYELDNEEVF